MIVTPSHTPRNGHFSLGISLDDFSWSSSFSVRPVFSDHSSYRLAPYAIQLPCPVIATGRLCSLRQNGRLNFSLKPLQFASDRTSRLHPLSPPFSQLTHPVAFFSFVPLFAPSHLSHTYPTFSLAREQTKVLCIKIFLSETLCYPYWWQES